jgi:RHS repeat-associated protein
MSTRKIIRNGSPPAMTQFQFNVNSQSLTGTVGWNPLGTPKSLNISDAFNSTDTQNCSYSHDDLTRLASVNCGTIWGQDFGYDSFGNISKTVISGSSGTSFQPTYATPSTNRIASLPSFTPTYDTNGNLTKDPQHQYGWDSEGRPVTIDTSITLTYDALDRMVEQNNSGTYTQIVYDPLGEKFGLMNGQTLKKAFAPLPDGGIAAYTSTGLSYYRHPDWLGSSRLASTPTRTIYSDTAYAPFGEPYAQSGTADVSFTGQNQDTASNLYDFLFREHSSIQGRWISPDPAGLAAVTLTDPQSWNRYAYVRNSPVLFADFLGLTCFKKVTNDDGSIGIMNEELPYDNESDCNSHGGSWITSTTTIQVNGGVPDGGDPTSPVLPLPDPPGFSTNGSGSANGPQRQAPKTPWYKNSCVTGALGKGALSVGIDSIGLIPDAGGIARVVGHQAGYVGVVADQVGSGVINAVGKTASAGQGLVGLSDTSPTGLISTGLTVAGFIPVANDVAAGLSIGLDIFRTGKAIAACY